jgi:hypothetical protein
MVNDLLPQLADTLTLDPPPASIAEHPIVATVAHDAAHLPIPVIVARITATGNGSAQVRAWSATLILEALARFPGDDWQARWNTATAGPEDWVAGLGNPWGTEDRAIRHAPRGITALIAADVIRPSYAWLMGVRLNLDQFREVRGPGLAQAIAGWGRAAGHPGHGIRDALRVLTLVLAHTGKPVQALTATDVLTYLEAAPSKHHRHGTNYAWDYLKHLGSIPAEVPSLRQHRREVRPTPAQIVEGYGITSPRMREMFSRYLQNRAAALDYSSLRSLAYELLRNFWADIQTHHPLESLNIGFDDGRAWLARHAAKGFADRHRTLFAIRGLYLDIAHWATHDPYWAEWSAQCFLSKADTAGAMKHKRHVQARIHQRIRLLAPSMPNLLGSVDRQRLREAELLERAEGTPEGDSFVFEGASFLRHRFATHARAAADRHIWIDDPSTGELIDQTYAEERAFWAWAAVHTLHQTGMRIEELMELTATAFVTYRVPTTGELLPLLQVLPSKSDQERMLLVSPELAHVLAAVRHRVRGDSTVFPLAVRYDMQERVFSPPLPFLFQIRRGSENRVFSTTTIANYLTAALQAAGMRTEAGDLPRLTPHDFRRVFATDAISTGLPIHIIAKLLGHQNINTTHGYAAVFDEDVIRHFRTYVDRRRSLRPTDDYRAPTDAELDEFHAHFLKRKVELGSCGRAYGTPCIHEHACIRSMRNRLIASHSQRTIVVEAGWRSGSLNTAGHAANIGRPLGAVPGPVTYAASAGCHRLIRDYNATLVTNVDEIAQL